MEQKWFSIKNWKFQTIIVLIFYTVGIIGHLWSVSYPWMVVLTPFVLLLSGIWAVYKSVTKVLLVFWVVLAYIVTFTLEALGTATSKVFGPYLYGDGLGLKLFDVPLIIGFNWVVIMFSLALFAEWVIEYLPKSVSERTWLKFLLSSLLASLLAVLFDFIMEPTAITYDYWQWTKTSDPYNIPFQNYLAWFLISLVFSATLLLIPKEKRISQNDSPHSIWFVVIQTFFFLVIRIGLIFFNPFG
jgi:putative membrane protein